MRRLRVYIMHVACIEFVLFVHNKIIDYDINIEAKPNWRIASLFQIDIHIEYSGLAKTDLQEANLHTRKKYILKCASM